MTKLEWNIQLMPALSWGTVKSVLGSQDHHLFTVETCPSPCASGHACSFL